MAILVTGATGNVGAEVLRCLSTSDCGQKVIAASRNPDSSQEPGSWVQLDLERRDTFEAALRGIDKMFFVRPPPISDVPGVIAPFLRAAQDQGVSHVVFLSLQGVERAKWAPHHKIEKLLESSGMAWTFLRAGFFMQNLSTTHREEVRDHDRLMVPAGRSRTAFVDVRDIAAVAAKTLLEDGHEGQSYELTGMSALTYWDVASKLSTALDRVIVYRRPNLAQFMSFRRRVYQTPWPMLAVMCVLYTITRLGHARHVSGHVERLLRRPPISFSQFAEDFKSAWEKPDASNE